jgi:hypothetical protein
MPPSQSDALSPVFRYRAAIGRRPLLAESAMLAQAGQGPHQTFSEWRRAYNPRSDKGEGQSRKGHQKVMLTAPRVLGTD